MNIPFYHGGSSNKKSWPGIGPQGPQGPEGPQGPQGEPGTGYDPLEYITLTFQSLPGEIQPDSFLPPHLHSVTNCAGYTQRGIFYLRSFGVCCGIANNITDNDFNLPIQIRKLLFVNPWGFAAAPVPSDGVLVAQIMLTIKKQFALGNPVYDVVQLGTGGSIIFGGFYEQFILFACIPDDYSPPEGCYVKDLTMWACIKREELT